MEFSCKQTIVYYIVLSALNLTLFTSFQSSSRLFLTYMPPSVDEWHNVETTGRNVCCACMRKTKQGPTLKENKTAPKRHERPKTPLVFDFWAESQQVWNHTLQRYFVIFIYKLFSPEKYLSMHTQIFIVVYKCKRKFHKCIYTHRNIHPLKKSVWKQLHHK